jgi:pyruvate,water dikinase
MEQASHAQWISSFEDLSADDAGAVGAKNASLGEMLRALTQRGIRVPHGFATTADAYRRFVETNDLAAVIDRELSLLAEKRKSLPAVGAAIRGAFLDGKLPTPLAAAIAAGYAALCDRYGQAKLRVAVRSSATAEDLPDASFAGQQETFLNIAGEDAIARALLGCYASLFTDRAIAYREEKGFDHRAVALSVGVQRLVRADKGAAGVIFTLEPESGFPNAVVISAAYGLGENVAQGTIEPDEYWLWKPGLADQAKRPILRKVLGQKQRTMIVGSSGTQNTDTPPDKRAAFAITDDEALALARWAVLIEEHYRGKRPCAMDIEWAKDGETGELFIVQARPETVHSQQSGQRVTRYALTERSEVLVRGRSVGHNIASGVARVLSHPSDPFDDGDVLVTKMTDPDWLPVMQRAKAIVTDHGGRTCHAAILSRELGIPAIVGTHHATAVLSAARAITVSCAEGEEGLVFDGTLAFEKTTIELGAAPPTRTKIMMNLADPKSAFSHWRLPTDGIGLARTEFIIANEARVHPMALLHPELVRDPRARAEIEALRAIGPTPEAWFVDTLARGVATIAASQHPKPVVVRMSDFKTNEYAHLLGGEDFEPREENPMIGFRGAARYYHDRYRDGFLLECAAMKRARELLGLDNIVLMIPFCRTPEEADLVLATMQQAGLERGKNGLALYMMCEVPSNVVLADAFARRFDGFSIGSNDLTQLTLGVDRDSELLAVGFDERNPAVLRMIEQAIERAHAAGISVGLCGQGPSDHPAFADLLVAMGIDSISLNPDSVVSVRQRVAAAERP